MSLDCLKNTYRRLDRFDTRDKTSYTKMHTWRDVINDPHGRGPRNLSEREYQDYVQSIMVPDIRETQMSRLSRNVEDSYRAHKEGLLKMPPITHTMPLKTRLELMGAEPVRSTTPVHLQYYKSNGYDDPHRATLNHNFRVDARSTVAKSFPLAAPARIRNGNGGSNWRHIKATKEPDGKRGMFIDGQVSLNDLFRMERIAMDEVLEPLNFSRKVTPEVRPPCRYRPPPPVKVKNIDAEKAMEMKNWYLIR